MCLLIGRPVNGLIGQNADGLIGRSAVVFRINSTSIVVS